MSIVKEVGEEKRFRLFKRASRQGRQRCKRCNRRPSTKEDDLCDSCRYIQTLEVLVEAE